MSFLQSLWGQAHLAPAFQVVVLWVMVLAVLASLACAILVVHHLFTSMRRRRRGHLVARATTLLAPHIPGAALLGPFVAESRRLHGDWATAIVLREARAQASQERAADLSAVLMEMGEVARLGRLAGSRQDWRRAKAVRELGQCGGDEALAVLLAAAHDRSPEVRRGAREGLLGDRRAASVRAAIQSYLEDERIGVASRRFFYSQLAATSSGDLGDLLRAGTLGSDEEKLALEAMGDARQADVLPLARARLTAADPEIRATSARVLGKLRDQESAEALERLLEDPEWFVRAAAAKAFEALEPRAQSQRLLSDLLSDDVWWVRANAAHALARQGNEGVSVLLAAADGTDEFSRDAALATLSLAVLTPVARDRLEERLRRAQPSPGAEPLHGRMAAVPAGARP